MKTPTLSHSGKAENCRVHALRTTARFTPRSGLAARMSPKLDGTLGNRGQLLA